MSALGVWVQLPQAGNVASTRNVQAYAAVAEHYGYTGAWLGDHIAMPEGYTSQYPYGTAHPVPADRPFLEAFTTLAFVAGATHRLRLAVAVAVAPYRHPLLQAKTIATLDVLSGGRLEVGFGSGWLAEEFEALSVSFADRQSLTDETLDVMRQLWTGEVVRHSGRHFQVEGVRCVPVPEQRPSPPLWIGGISPKALRRVVELGAGWLAPDLSTSELSGLIARLRGLRDEAAPPPRVSARVAIQLAGPVADGALALVPDDLRLLHELRDAGVTDIRLELTTLPPRERVGAVARLARTLEEEGLKRA